MKLKTWASLTILVFVLGCKEPTKEVFVNYEKNSAKIYKAVRYYESIKPKEVNMDIEFESDDVFHLYISKPDSSEQNSPIFDQYGSYKEKDIPINDLNNPKYQEALRISKLTKPRLDSLRTYLFAANCFCISQDYWQSDSMSHYLVGYKRSWQVDITLYYLIYEKELPKPLMDSYEESCSFKKINDKVIVQYVPDYTFGNWCFPDKR